MEKREASLAEIRTVPRDSLILLVGPPGSGKSTFCQQVVLNSLAVDRPVIIVTTEQGPDEVLATLREKGMGAHPSGTLRFVDAFGETVGATTPERPDTALANCEDLNSMNMAIARQRQGIDDGDILLAFDSLTSPYLFNKDEVFRFLRLSLLKFATGGNSVLALVDEGCGREEDLVAMMSVADGILQVGIERDTQVIDVVKHPNMAPTRIETPLVLRTGLLRRTLDREVGERIIRTGFVGRPGHPVRAEVGDFVHILWRNLASWSGMLWDPRRFPTMAYELDKEHESTATESIVEHLPWYKKLLFKLFLPRSLSEVKDMQRAVSGTLKMGEGFGIAIVEYDTEDSRRNEHYFRLYESSSCWGFEDTGAQLAFHDCGEWAGALKGLDKEGQDWNVVETKCIGLGDPYCEFKAVPGEIGEQREALASIDSAVVERIQERLMEQLTRFLIHGEPLPERPRLGSGVSFHEMHHVTGIPATFSERYRMALRMGGAKAGKEVGERLLDAQLTGDEVIERVLGLMDYCKVGKVTWSETIRIWENCESFVLDTGEPFCFFTTGFLNGLFSVVKNQHVREVRCVAAGDPYCEWEIV